MVHEMPLERKFSLIKRPLGGVKLKLYIRIYWR